MKLCKLKVWDDFIYLYFIFVFGDRISLCTSDCPWNYSIDHANLELRNVPASASWMLQLKVCTTTVQFGTMLNLNYIYTFLCLLIIIFRSVPIKMMLMSKQFLRFISIESNKDNFFIIDSDNSKWYNYGDIFNVLWLNIFTHIGKSIFWFLVLKYYQKLTTLLTIKGNAW